MSNARTEAAQLLAAPFLVLPVTAVVSLDAEGHYAEAFATLNGGRER